MIPIKNIYHMLSYVFYELQKKGYESLEVEEFDNIFDLYSEILILGMNKQIKRGIEKSYIEHEKQTPLIRGKMNITKSIRSYIKQKQVICQYDIYDSNTIKNQIIKTTLYHLLKTDIKSIRKNKIKKIIYYLNDIELIDINKIKWNFRYNRNNQTYILLLNICYLIINGLLQKDEKGENKLISLAEDNMPRLYEKFILEYYKREHPKIKTSSMQIKWQVDDEFDLFLPVMQTDITLSQENKILIIDAKYYKHTLQEHYETKTIHSNNLYQIFTYVKNKEEELKDEEHTVSGMLLYAKTDEKDYPDYTYNMSGNKISTKVLELNVDFKEIKNQLDNIVEEYFS